VNLEYAGRVRDEPRLLGKLLGYDRLLPLHDRWIRECWDTKGSHALMAYRGSYKTTAVVTVGIIRYLLFFPAARILVIRKTFTDASKVLRTVSAAFDKPALKALFYEVQGIVPKKTVDGNGQLSFNFKYSNTIEANLTAYGIGTSITGTHADAVIADDIIGLEDRLSHAERDSVKEHIREIAANIIDPGALTIWLGTKWAQGDGWDVIGEFTEIKKYPVEKYNFLPAGEIEEKRRRLTPFLFAVNYSLELIADESLMFQEPKKGPFDPESWRMMPVAAHLDAAYGGDDACALTIMAGDHMTGFLHEGHVQGWYGFIAEKYRFYHCREILLETNSDKGYAARDLRKLGLSTRTYTERDNKAIKISTYLYGAWKDLVWDEGTDGAYMEQILDYKSDNSTGHDDAPDSAACLCRDRARAGGAASEEALKWLFGKGA
jgi:hypothetical protein